ncbi:MAG: hypothetical protein DRP79_03205 [Planctomycetota bacterium]|nr:MAG: hypothetical protein DRP79_03205 [Planctomycetota bacterium]
MRRLIIFFPLLVLAGGFSLSADEKTAPVDVVALIEGGSFRGHVLSVTEDGRLRFRPGESESVTELNVTAVRHIALNTERNLPGDYLKRRTILHLSDGSRITGSIEDWRADSVVIKNEYCAATILKCGITDISFTTDSETFLPYNSGKSDVIVLRENPDEKVECEILSISDLHVRYRVKGEERSAGFNAVCAVALAGSEKPVGKGAKNGWYAMVRVINRDRLVGTLAEMDKSALTLLTRYAGLVSLKRNLLDKVAFSDSPSFSYGNLLVTYCSNGVVAMYDSSGKRLWKYGKCSSPWDAVELPDGDILVAPYNQGRSLWLLSNKGEDVKKIAQNLSEPISVVLLENGNYLTSEYSHACLVEVTPNGAIKQRYLQGRMSNGVHIELARDDCVVTANGGNRVTKWSLKSNKVVWRKDGLQGAYGAVELGNGCIAVMEYNIKKVRVFDKNGNEKWSVNTNYNHYGVGVTPDGNALIPVMQRRNNRNVTVIIEYSPDGKKLREIPLQEEVMRISSIRQR